MAEVAWDDYESPIEYQAGQSLPNRAGSEDHYGRWDSPPLLALLFHAMSPSRRKRSRFLAGRRVGGGLKEPFCALSHLTGVILSLITTLVLVLAAAGRVPHLVGFLLFGSGLITVYTASTLYHALRVPRCFVARLQRFDHIAIFLLIAGTFAPVCLVPLWGVWGWSLLAAEYTLALAGILGVSFLHRRLPEWLRVGLCVAMGWLILVAFVPLRNALPASGLAWLVAGGLLYSGGTVILATDRPHLWPGRFSAHDLWHLFVLGGSACHVVLMTRFIAAL